MLKIKELENHKPILAHLAKGQPTFEAYVDNVDKSTLVFQVNGTLQVAVAVDGTDKDIKAGTSITINAETGEMVLLSAKAERPVSALPKTAASRGCASRDEALAERMY